MRGKGVHVSVPGLENICTVMPRKTFLLWALLPKTFYIASTTVPCCLGLPRCLTQPQGQRDWGVSFALFPLPPRCGSTQPWAQHLQPTALLLRRGARRDGRLRPWGDPSTATGLTASGFIWHIERIKSQPQQGGGTTKYLGGQRRERKRRSWETVAGLFLPFHPEVLWLRGLIVTFF